jgi:hypothetical protein
MKRSDRQNRYYWKCIVLPLCDHTGYHKFEMHEILTSRFIADRSKALTKEEFNQYCEEVRIWAFEELDVNLMPPNEYQ